MMHKLLLTVQEAANFLKVSKSTINNLRKSGIIQCHKTGGNVRFTHKDLLNYCVNISIGFCAECKRSIIYLDKKSYEVVPFEKERIYKIVDENRFWISIFSKEWEKSARFSKKEFNKYFSKAENWQVNQIKYNYNDLA